MNISIDVKPDIKVFLFQILNTLALVLLIFLIVYLIVKRRGKKR